MFRVSYLFYSMGSIALWATLFSVSGSSEVELGQIPSAFFYLFVFVFNAISALAYTIFEKKQVSISVYSGLLHCIISLAGFYFSYSTFELISFKLTANGGEFINSTVKVEGNPLWFYVGPVLLLISLLWSLSIAIKVRQFRN